MFNEQEKQIIIYGKQSGKSAEEISNAIGRYRAGISNAPEPQADEAPSYLSQVGEAAGAGVQRIGEGIKQATTPPSSGVVDDSAFNLPLGTLKAGTGALATVYSPLAPLFKPIAEGFQKLTDYISSTKPFAEYGAGTADLPAAKQTGAEMALEGVSGIADIAGAIAGLKPSAATIGKGTTGAKSTSQLIASGGDKAFDTAMNLRKRAQVSIAKSSVNPQLQSSAERLFLGGTKRLDDPLKEYEAFVNQSRQAITDIKVDPAISVVGDRVGQAFNGVIAARKVVGKTMSEELKKVGSVKTNVLPVVDDFVADLGTEGLVFDRVKRTIQQTSRQSKMGATDMSLLETYATELQKLGSKPTISELDAFLSRISKDIDIYKSSKGIVTSTNAERIIKKSLANLRDQFSPEKTGNKALAGYSEARKAYSELSDFINEGVPYLGKITQSGDFAKDASLLKSAVQSVLNNGKKDWLLQLEALTGYQAIDEAVLALQAMKDVGDFRGVSLLQLLSDGAVPTSKAGFTQKIIDYALEKGKEAVAGSPEEQTKAFLAELKKELTRGTSQ